MLFELTWTYKAELCVFLWQRIVGYQNIRSVLCHISPAAEGCCLSSYRSCFSLIFFFIPVSQKLRGNESRGMKCAHYSTFIFYSVVTINQIWLFWEARLLWSLPLTSKRSLTATTARLMLYISWYQLIADKLELVNVLADEETGSGVFNRSQYIELYDTFLYF